MHDVKLSGIDLNLLVTLDSLLRERSVQGAARRVGLSQPAMSHALRRLRETVGDPLLVRHGSRMQPTARALALEGPLRRCLADLHAMVFDTPRFSPASSRRAFRMASEGYFSATLLPQLTRLIAEQAPGVDLEVEALADLRPHQLTEGHVDLWLGVAQDAPAGVTSETLYRERVVCLVGPSFGRVRRFSSERYARARHVVIRLGDRRPTFIDEALAREGLSRRVALRVGHFLAAPFAVAESELVFTCPRRLATQFARIVPALRIALPPREIDRSFDYSMLWDERCAGDPAHQWLRARLREACTTPQRSAEP